MSRIENITIIGVGLIGTSLALALKQAGFSGTILGSDRAEALHEAGARGAIDVSAADPVEAVRKAALVVLAAPVRTNIEILKKIAPHLPEGSLITDVGSTKQDIAKAAEDMFGADALRRFLPGHPIAGKEFSGAANADASLFRNATWVLTPTGGRHALIAPEFSRGVHREYLAMLESIGARVVVTTPEKHDRVLAFTSHLPQLVATALANAVKGELADSAELRDLSGRALREMTRLAKSDTQLWSEVAAANSQNIRDAIDAVHRHLGRLRDSVGTADFEAIFDAARDFDPDAQPKTKDDSEPPRFD